MVLKLEKIIFTNYKCFRSFELDFDFCTTLIGENGIGKSTILDGINEWEKDDLQLSPTTRYNGMLGTEKQSIEYFFSIDPTNGEKVKIEKNDVSIKISEDGFEFTDDSVEFNYNNLNSIEILVSKGENKELTKKEFSEFDSYNASFLNFKRISSDTNLKTISFQMPMDKKDFYTLRLFQLFYNYHQANLNGENYITVTPKIRGASENHNLPNFLSIFKKEAIKLIKDQFRLFYLSQAKSIDPIKNNFTISSSTDDINIKNIFTQFPLWDQVVANSSYAFRSNFIEKKQIQINQWLKKQAKPISSFKFQFQCYDNNVGLLIRDSNEKLLDLEDLSTGIQWIFRFIFIFLSKIGDNDFLSEENNKSIILIDEPGQFLHYRSQQEVLKFIQSISKYSQIIYSTHYHELIDYQEINTIRFLKKDEENNCIIIEKNPFNSRIFIEDMLRNVSPEEAAILLSKKYYQAIKSETINQLNNTNLVNEIHQKFEQDISDGSQFQKILGTKEEDPYLRFLYDAHFLTTPANVSPIHSDVTFLLEQIYIVQIFKNNGEVITTNRFDKLCENWGSEGNHLVYSDGKKQIAIKKIQCILNQIKFSINSTNSLIIFPECVVPYQFLEHLIDYTQENLCVINGGCEHIQVKEFFNQTKGLKRKYKSLSQYLGNLEEEILEDFELEDYLNLSVIIWWGPNIVFQIKNNPARIAKNIWEDIKTRRHQQYNIVRSPFGNISCYICRDFLVNHTNIPKWMDIHDVKILLIPSFTSRVIPFLNRLKHITTYKSQSDKIFIYANLAEYAGSDVLNFSNRMIYEPTQQSYYKREEGYFLFDLIKMKQKNDEKLTYKPEFYPLQENE